MHRSFRVNRPIQIIRYSNRLEISNPGFSLKSPEHLGEPGSELRNPYISAIFHDTNLAETKGSGIRSMREQMKMAHLMPPTFESNRETNSFTIRLLLHHLLGEDDIKWIATFAHFDLNNEQRLSLIFLRELGAIDNITYRQLNSDITSRKATFDLHRMCQEGLFELRGQRRNAYYIAGQEFVRLNSRSDDLNSRANGLNGRADEKMYGGDGEMYGGDGEMCRADGEMCRADGEMCRADGEMCRANGEMCRADGEMCRANGEMCRADILPLVLQERIKKIGKRAASSEIRSLIIELCTFAPFGIAGLAQLLNRDMKALRYHYINPLLKQGKLFYTIPEMLNHPNQKYTTKKKQ